jgi:hypothetical protein
MVETLKLEIKSDLNVLGTINSISIVSPLNASPF